MPKTGENERFWGDLFPTKLGAFVFVSYIVLFINQGILVASTKNADNKYSYNTTTVVLMTECLKLLVSTVIYLKDNSVHQLFHDTFKNFRVLLFYLVPAFLYCLYNNLAFINLAVFDPTTYYLLLQFRVVVTAVIFQILFKKHLSKKQWISLILLTCGCIIKQLKVSHPKTSVTESSDVEMSSFLKLHLNFNLMLILVQVFCSCFAGVYNEYLLKDTGAHVHLMIQNIFMYFDSILCNFLVLIFKGEIMNVFNVNVVSSALQPLIILVILNGSGCGIITSVFLKNLNSILKNFASALELVFTAVLCWIIFDISIDIFTILSIAIVSYATFMYSQNPVVNTVRADTKDENQENCV